MRCKCGKQLTVKPAVVYCPDSGGKMEEQGSKFFDHVKFINLHASRKASELQYVFTLSVGGIFINGCTFNPRAGSLKMPTAMAYGRKYRMVKLSGSFAKTARQMPNEELTKRGWSLSDEEKEQEAA
jgi:hypothetical protein